MAKYQGAIYRGTVYGNPPRTVLSAEPMTAVALDYGQIKVTWQPPAGTFTKFRLVRNNSNFPENEEDGIILYEQSSSTSLSGALGRTFFTDGVDNFQDTNPNNDVPITVGQFIYYSAFIFTSAGIWILAGNISELMPANRGSQEKLFSYLPRVYTTKEQSPTGIPDPDSFLYTFLKPFSFTYDQMLTYADLVRPSYGKKRIPPQFLGIAQNHLGLAPEHGLPYKNQKKLIRESVYLYKTKGTLLGISGYAESLTGFAPTVTVSPNLLLDTQDSSFTKFIGRWKKSYGTLTAVSNKVGPDTTNAIDKTWSGRFVTSVSVVTLKKRLDNVATLTLSEAHGLEIGDTVNVTGVDSSFNANGLTVASVPTGTSFTYANSGVNLSEGAATGSVTNTSSMYLGTSSNVNPRLTTLGGNAPTNGVPVTAGSAYTFSFHAASDANGTVEAKIYWYDSFGVYISANSGSENGTTGVYQRFSVAATAPTGAVYAGFRLRFRTQGSYNIDMVQMALTARATNYDEARGIDIFLDAKKVNILRNPSFETNSTGWTTNSSTTRVTDTKPDGIPGTYSLKLTGQNTFSLSTICNTLPTFYPLPQSNFYTFSIYMKASAARTLTFNLSAVNDGATATETATATVALTTSWARHSVTVYIPDGFSPTDNITVTFTANGTLTGQDIWVDAAQFEQSSNPTDYFDGSLPVTTGVFWSGTAHASYSYYYRGRTIKIPRLLLTLDEWVPYKTPWRVLSWKGIEGTSTS